MKGTQQTLRLEKVNFERMASQAGKYQFKIVLLGEGCVGKTSLVLRYCQEKFNDKHLTTLQVSLNI